MASATDYEPSGGNKQPPRTIQSSFAWKWILWKCTMPKQQDYFLSRFVFCKKRPRNSCLHESLPHRLCDSKGPSEVWISTHRLSNPTGFSVCPVNLKGEPLPHYIIWEKIQTLLFTAPEGLKKINQAKEEERRETRWEGGTEGKIKVYACNLRSET